MEKEFEAKSLLTLKEYEILKSKFKNICNEKNLINYYFETSDLFFKKNNSALRIRVINSIDYELTLKIKKDNYNEEYNISITSDNFNTILKNKEIDLSLFLNSPLCGIKNKLEYNIIETNRFEFIEKNITYVLDKCLYNNMYEDFELEVESSSMTLSENSLKNFLNEHSITYKQSKPKIARLYSYCTNKKEVKH